MKVLMLSLDRGLIVEGSSGDVLARHQKYAQAAGSLDVVVFSERDQKLSLSPEQNLRIFPTGSTKWNHFRKAVDLAATLHQENRYDLLVTQEFAAPAGAQIKAQTGLPWIVNIHSMFFSAEWLKFHPVHWYLFFRIRRSIRVADGFRVNNAIIENTLRQWRITVPILVQPTPVDAKKFWAEHKPENLVPKILYAGRLSPEKNIAMLIAAAKKINVPFELSVAGEGPEENRLKQLSGSDDRIKFLGPRTHDALVPLYQNSDIFVLPSNTESYGKVLVEAGAAGCALIATATVGAKNVISEPGLGTLIKVGDEEGLSRALRKMLLDKNYLLGFSGNAGKFLGRYDASIALAKTVEFWKKIAKK